MFYLDQFGQISQSSHFGLFCLANLALSKDYQPGTVNNAIEKDRSIPRQEALKKVVQSKDSKRPVFVISFDPRLPSISAIIQKHWRTMSKDPRLAEIFPLPPMVAYKRPPNIKQKIIRAKILTTILRPKRESKGMSWCLNCSACFFIKEGHRVEATQSNFKIDINV